MLERLLFLRPGELRRLLPFFCVYLFLFAAFAVADALALSLFVKHVPRGLAEVYGMVAIANLIVIALYLQIAERWRASWVLQVVLLANIAVFGCAWIGLLQSENEVWYETLFVCREVAFTLVLMHFGTYLQDYFTRDEMNRVLPLVYAGGRVGGLVGGSLLQFLADPMGLVNMLGVFIGLCAGGVAVVAIIAQISERAPREGTDRPTTAETPRTPEEDARASYPGFLRYVWQSPLLFWISITTLLFITCRWMLNYQYTMFLGEYFEDEDELAEFLGIYTQIALLAAIVIQILIVNRLIGWLGLKGAHLLYGMLLLGGALACVGSMTLTLAVLARFIETELRFGLRNPIQQLLTNQFPKTLRVRVRAWNFGTVIPLGTMLSSILLTLLSGEPYYAWIPWLGAGCGVIYVLATFGLMRSFDEPRRPPEPEPAANPGRAMVS